MTLLALNPALATSLLAAAASGPGPTGTQQLSQHIFRLAAHPNIREVPAEALTQIRTGVQSDDNLTLKYVDQLQSSADPSAIAQALIEIGSRQSAVGRLATANPPDLSQLDIPERQLETDSEITLQAWLSSLTGGQISEEALTLGQRWGRYGYFLSGAAHMLGIPAALMTAATALIMGDPVVGGISAGFLTTYLANFLQRYRRSNIMLQSTEQGPFTPRQIEAYLKSYQLYPGALRELREASAHRDQELFDVIAAIEASAGPRGLQPTLSSRAFLQGLYNFLNISTIGNLGLARDANGDYYDLAAQAIGLGVMQRLQWQPLVLHGERLQELKELQRNNPRARFVFVPNHRSHLDTLVTVSLVRDFRARFVAKDALGKAPGLGWSLFPEPWHPLKNSLIRGPGSMLIHRGGEASHRHLTAFVGEKFAAHESVVIFPEQTRLDTTDRNVELGMRPYREGIFHAAHHWTNIADETYDIYFVPLSYYGVGRIFPKSNDKASSEGGLMNQPVAMSIGTPIQAPKRINSSGESDRDYIHALNRTVWWQHWQQLAALQSFMNRYSPAISR